MTVMLMVIVLSTGYSEVVYNVDMCLVLWTDSMCDCVAMTRCLMTSQRWMMTSRRLSTPAVHCWACLQPYLGFFTIVAGFGRCTAPLTVLCRSSPLDASSHIWQS